MDRFSFEADPVTHWPCYYGSGQRPNGSTRPILILSHRVLSQIYFMLKIYDVHLLTNVLFKKYERRNKLLKIYNKKGVKLCHHQINNSASCVAEQPSQITMFLKLSPTWKLWKNAVKV